MCTKRTIRGLTIRSLLKLKYQYPILVSLFFLVGCSDLFEYSLFDANVESHSYNSSSIDLIANSIPETDTIKFALISDSHNNYDDLSDAIRSINKYNDLQFVVTCGDITTFGLAWEYEKYSNLIKDFSFPVITVIGNHDYLSNGVLIYNRLFGSRNISFRCGNYKFVVFDDVVWENNNKSPDFKWLAGELSNDSVYNVLLTHMPPWDEQLDGAYNQIFEQTVNKSNTILCLHGHQHSFKELDYNGIYTVIASCIKDREFYIVELIGTKAFVEKVHY